MSDTSSAPNSATPAQPDSPRDAQLELQDIDLERLTRLVYRLMQEDLSLGQERGR